ncbi:hypothetical protein B0H19DRAFT_1265560 [Mycena capillaripes]|nr:hypothetical protein B0H19DRAFT_1265560 [Mycena capillaripes]
MPPVELPEEKMAGKPSQALQLPRYEIFRPGVHEAALLKAGQIQDIDRLTSCLRESLLIRYAAATSYIASSAKQRDIRRHILARAYGRLRLPRMSLAAECAPPICRFRRSHDFERALPLLATRGATQNNSDLPHLQRDVDMSNFTRPCRGRIGAAMQVALS